MCLKIYIINFKLNFGIHFQIAELGDGQFQVTQLPVMQPGNGLLYSFSMGVCDYSPLNDEMHTCETEKFKYKF